MATGVDDLSRWGDAARRGDTHALEALLGALQNEVWRYCASMVGATDADDAAQDALVRVVTSIRTYEASSPVRVWVMGVARHACLDWLRSSYRHRALQDRVRQHTTQSVRHEYGWNDTAELLADLDPDRREAFVLTQVLGFSYETTAEICDCAVGTVRSRVARARIDLLRALDAAETGGAPGMDTGVARPRVRWARP